MGLWGYSQGVDPEQTWERLGAVLDTLLKCPELESSLLAEAPAPQGECTPIQDGSAGWMDAALAQPGRPYHEDGYDSWFDFNRHAPKLAKYRRMHDRVRQGVRRVQLTSHAGGAQELYQDALHVFLAHQYEFGCIGIGHATTPYHGWDGMQAALVLARAAEWSAEPWEGVRWEDLNQDGLVEGCLCDGCQLAVVSPIGGRLLYWLDLKEGKQLLGNPLAVAPGSYACDSALPTVYTHPLLWLPGEIGSSPSDLVDEQPPTRLGKYLPDWIWESQVEPLTLAVRRMALPGEPVPALSAQRRGFVDVIRLAGGESFDAGARMDPLPEGGEDPGFSRRLGEQLKLRKQYRLRSSAVEVTYTLENSGLQAALSLSTTCEVCLDYAAVLRYGEQALVFNLDSIAPEVMNPLTRERLALHATRPWRETLRRKSLLALEIGCSFAFEIQANTIESFKLTLARGAV